MIGQGVKSRMKKKNPLTLTSAFFFFTPVMYLWRSKAP